MAKPPPPIYAPIRDDEGAKIGSIDTMTILTEGNRVMLAVYGELSNHPGRVKISLPLPAGWSLVRTEDTDG